ncbi:substrate-binding periplasmic protein [Duganella sp. P38]|jgi:ABC-type amino acid transport substrate-binding protein|uniref:substrate-binding periplasmic protein n=1 Tax=Duganella sp. P38 TaxID=3423949 RepID=UPI003D7996DC
MKNRLRYLAGIAAALALLCGSTPRALAAQAASGIAVLVADQSAPGAMPSSGQITLNGVVGLLAAESGLNLTVHAYPWRRAQLMAKNGEGLLYGAAETPERAAAFTFTKPLYMVNQWLVTPAQHHIDFRRWEDLRGKVISIGAGGHFGPEFEEHRDKTFTVQDNTATISGRFKMLNMGRVDALLIDSFRSAPQLEQRLNCLYGDIGAWAVMAKPVSAEAVTISVAKTSPLHALVPQLNDAIDRLNKTRGFHKYLDRRAAAPGC